MGSNHVGRSNQRSSEPRMAAPGLANAGRGTRDVRIPRRFRAVSRGERLSNEQTLYPSLNSHRRAFRGRNLVR